MFESTLTSYNTATTEAVLFGYTVNRLKVLFQIAKDILNFPPATVPTRKDQLVQGLTGALSSVTALKKIYESMNDLERCAVQEAVASVQPVDWARFEAKYGGLPNASFMRATPMRTPPPPL